MLSEEKGIYKTTVPYDISEITIKATPKDEKTTITGDGVVQLETGENSITITQGDQLMDKGRMEAFSDGVIAIITSAMTSKITVIVAKTFNIPAVLFIYEHLLTISF